MQPLLRPLVAFCLSTLCASLALKAQMPSAQVPSILEPKFERHQGPPLWISAEMAADSQKIINLDLIGDFHLRGYVEDQRRLLGDQRLSEVAKEGSRPNIATIPSSQCTSDILSSELRGGGHPSATLRDLAAYSQSILRGTILTVEPGFASGTPASLIGLQISGVIKGSEAKSPVYIAYPVAHFAIGPFSFCNAEKGFEPHPGDQVLLFDYIGPIDRDQILYTPRLEQIFFQNQNKQLFLPAHLKNTSELKTTQSLDDVLKQLQSILQSPPGGAR